MCKYCTYSSSDLFLVVLMDEDHAVLIYQGLVKCIVYNLGIMHKLLSWSCSKCRGVPVLSCVDSDVTMAFENVVYVPWMKCDWSFLLTIIFMVYSRTEETITPHSWQHYSQSSPSCLRGARTSDCDYTYVCDFCRSHSLWITDTCLNAQTFGAVCLGLHYT